MELGENNSCLMYFFLFYLIYFFFFFLLSYFNGPTWRPYEIMSKKTIPESNFCLRIKFNKVFFGLNCSNFYLLFLLLFEICMCSAFWPSEAQVAGLRNMAQILVCKLGNSELISFV